jgi:hypothetical protein
MDSPMSKGIPTKNARRRGRDASTGTPGEGDAAGDRVLSRFDGEVTAVSVATEFIDKPGLQKVEGKSQGILSQRATLI